MSMFKKDAKFKELKARLDMILKNKSEDVINSLVKTYIEEYIRYPTFKYNIFPNKEEITEDEIKSLFSTYISSGDLKGHKRVFYNGLCILTNETKESIDEAKHSFEEYVELLKVIHKMNLDKINNYRIKNKLTKENSAINNSANNVANNRGNNLANNRGNNIANNRGNNLANNSSSKQPEQDPEIEIDIDANINVLKNIVIILSKNQSTLANPYLNKFVDLLKSEQMVDRIVDIWDDLKQQVVAEIDEIEKIIAEIKGADVALQAANALKQLGELRNVYNDDKTRYGDDQAKEIATNTKLSNIKRYFTSYLFTIPFKIKNEVTSEPLEYKSKPENWKISQNYVDKLSEILMETGKLCDKHILNKRTHNLGFVLESLCLLVKNNKNNLVDMVAKEHELSCDGQIKIYSKCTNQNLARLYQLVFILIFKDLLTANLDIASHISRNIKKSSQFINDESIDSSQGAKNNRAVDDEVLDDSMENSDMMTNKSGEVDLEEMKSLANQARVDLAIDILMEIEKTRSFMDKHSKTDMSENIEKKLESDKEDNLAIMKELDRESRQSLTSMIKLGMTTWKNLSKNEDVKLHFMDTLEEIEEPSDDQQPLISEEDAETNLHQQALEQLGENFTNEQFDDWNEQRLRREREDRDAQNDMDVMPDDDGDDYGMEAEGDDAYF